MGLFAHYARKLWEVGIQPVPVEPGTKICRIKNSNEIFFKHFLSEKFLDSYEKSHGHWAIGMAMGKVSGVIGIDFDYEGYEDSNILENMLLTSLPSTPLIKKGKKGWTRFYKYNDFVSRIRHIKRNGNAFFDLLSTGSITVLPPTLHSEGINYRWLSEESFDDIDKNELPELDYWTIDHICELAKIDLEDAPAKNDSRHHKILGYVLKESDWATNFEDFITSVLNHDIKINEFNPKGPYFADPKYLKNKSSHESCSEVVDRMLRWKKAQLKSRGLTWELGQSSKVFNKNNKATVNYEHFVYFFEYHYPDVRCNFIDNIAYTKFRGNWIPIENLIDVIESKAITAGLSHSKVKFHLARWISEKKRKFLIDIPAWDRKDHIGYVINHMEFNKIEKQFAIELFKEWMGLVFSRMYNSKIQNRMVILRGAQGIGKDTLIRNLFAGFNTYFSEVVLINDNRENYQTLSSLGICHISEFKETAKVSYSLLKSLITADRVYVRRSFGRKAESLTMNCSFVSSDNFQHILRDPSGNRRFMIFDVNQIKWDFAQLNPIGIVAQAHYLHEINYRASNTARSTMDNLILNETPHSNEELFLEEAKALIKSKELFLTKIRWSDISDDVSKIARHYNYQMPTALSILKSSGITKIGHGNMRYYSSD